MSMMIPAWIDDVLQPVEKLAVHQRGLRHQAVSVFVLAGSKTLIQRRALGKYHTPGLWANTCCTHPNWNEDPLTCAHRRLNDELGIEGLSPIYRRQVEYRADVGGGLTEHEVVDIYTADATEELVIKMNPAEVLDTKWIELDQLLSQAKRTPAMFTPWLRIYLEKYLDDIIC